MVLCLKQVFPHFGKGRTIIIPKKEILKISSCVGFGSEWITRCGYLEDSENVEVEGVS